MERTAEIIDILEHIRGQHGPIRVIDRGDLETWKARVEPLDFEKPDAAVNWSITQTGPIVRIPLIPYQLPLNPPRVLLAVMDITQRLLAAVPNALRTHFVIGDPVQDLTDEGIDRLRLWLGFAAVIPRQSK